jgi:hypothetical protein
MEKPELTRRDFLKRSGQVTVGAIGATVLATLPGLEGNEARADNLSEAEQKRLEYAKLGNEYLMLSQKIVEHIFNKWQDKFKDKNILNHPYVKDLLSIDFDAMPAEGEKEWGRIGNTETFFITNRRTALYALLMLESYSKPENNTDAHEALDLGWIKQEDLEYLRIMVSYTKPIVKILDNIGHDLTSMEEDKTDLSKAQKTLGMLQEQAPLK